jgi:DNA-binding NarL/FixJ family response regulator
MVGMPTATPAAVIRVLIVGSHALTRAALACLLQASGHDLVVAGEAEHLPEIVQPSDNRPDVILLALDCPDDHERFRSLAANTAGRPPLVVITDDYDPRLFRSAIQMGAAGIVLRSDTPGTLIKAIQKTNAGEMWLRRSQMADALRSARGDERSDSTRQIASLTRREREVVGLVADGLSNRAIADRLFISEATVRNHVTSILDKVQLRNRSELVVFAFRRGLVRA